MPYSAVHFFLLPDGFREDCLANPSYCKHGMSIAFWIRIRGGRSIIASGGLTNSTRGTGIRISYNPFEESYLVKLISNERIYQLTAPAIRYSWCHVTVTWSYESGLRFFSDEELKATDRHGFRTEVQSIRYVMIQAI